MTYEGLNARDYAILVTIWVVGLLLLRVSSRPAWTVGLLGIILLYVAWGLGARSTRK